MSRGVRHAVKSLRRSPWYAASAVGVLGLGLALAMVAFAVVDGVLFKPLPYTRPDELFVVRPRIAAQPQIELPSVSGREWTAWNRAAPDLALAAISLMPLPADTRGGRERIDAAIDERFLHLLGVQLVLGGFNADDFTDAWRTPTVWLQPTLISYRTWRQEYGGDPGVVGRHVIVRTDREGIQFGLRIAGVLPEGFVLPVDSREVAQLSPMTTAPSQWLGDLQVIARVAPDAQVATEARLQVATLQLALQAPPLAPHPSRAPRPVFDAVALVPVEDLISAKQRPAFLLIFAATAVLLVLAGVNVAGLSTARGFEHRADLAIRRALGASPGLLAHGLLMETAVIVVLALVVSWLAARPLLILTVDLLPATVGLLKEPALDWRVFAASAVAAVALLVAISVWPAVEAMRVDPRALLAARQNATGRIRRFHPVLIATQVALGFILLIAGGLTITSVGAAYLNDTGYRRDGTVLLEVFVRRTATATAEVEALRQVPETLSRIPGVSRVAVSTINPLFSQRANRWTQVVPAGWTADPGSIVSREVSETFFDVMGLRLVQGRWPQAGEWSATQPVAIVSEQAARTFWPDESALGRVLVERSPRQQPGERRVIAVVANARYAGLDATPLGDVYLPDPLASEHRTGVFFHVATTAPAAGVRDAILARLDHRTLRVTQAVTHAEALFASVKHRVLPAWLFGSLGVGALAMVGAGMFGLLAMSVTQRTRELGVRVALGATSGRLIRQLLTEQLPPVAAGLAMGMLISAWSVRVLESHLYNVDAFSAGVWSTVAVTLLAVAAAGTAMPSARASRVDPAAVLRDT